MLYEFNGKIYVKPFPNKIVEVKISKKGNEFSIEPTSKMLYITPEIKDKLVSITNEDAFKLYKGKTIIDNI